MAKRTILVTGGCGFIGSAFLDYMIPKYPDDLFINIDNLSYAGNRDNNNATENYGNWLFYQTDIRDKKELTEIFDEFLPTHIVHFAAWSHVDKANDSLFAPHFVTTNVVGTHNLLELAKLYKVELFIYISTDEVYGERDFGFSTEEDALNPRNLYSATKASGEHLVNAFNQTWGLPTIITRCTNNYGIRQYSEKFIPHSIQNLINNLPIDIYGSGFQSRQWIHVLDHVKAINYLMHSNDPGVYNISGGIEMLNIDLAKLLCLILHKDPTKYIQHIKDRPGHDSRYAIHSDKLKLFQFMNPAADFHSTLLATVQWYADVFTKEKELLLANQ